MILDLSCYIHSACGLVVGFEKVFSFDEKDFSDEHIEAVSSLMLLFS